MKNNINLMFVRFYRKSSKYDLELNADLKEIIIGLMLGDLFAEKRNPNSNTRLQFKQSIKNKVYIEHLYSIFKDYCNSEPKITTSIDQRPGKKDLNISIKFWTQSLPCFNQLYETFYVNGKKIIPTNIAEILTPVSLAYWIMDDGGFTGSGLKLYTNAFSLDDLNLLVDALDKKCFAFY